MLPLRRPAMAAILSIPEEVLEQILDLVITPPSVDAVPRPSWHRHSPSSSSSGSSRSSSPAGPLKRTPPHLSPLFVCRQWHRIAIPLQYRYVVLRYEHQATLLARTLREDPGFGYWTRSIRVEGTFAALGDIAPFCPSIGTFDLTIDNGTSGSSPSVPSNEIQIPHEATNGPYAVDERLSRFCASFKSMQNIRHLVLRKKAYLTQAGPAYVFEELSKVISGWQRLVSTGSS